MRKLASIRTIDSVRSIPGADQIECAVIDGWTVVVRKGEYTAGDRAIYCEVDSFIPHEIAPFLDRGTGPTEFSGVQGYRLRTMRLRGQLSQGLLLPMSLVRSKMDIAVGDDVTQMLGILKYEPPIPACLSGEVKGVFPGYIPKTDEERIQNLASQWGDLKQLTYEVTEKLEGSSMTVAIDADGDFIVCGRNLNLKESEKNSLWKVARAYNIEQRLRDNNLTTLALQGEIVGEGIQGNYYGIKGQDFYVYTVYDYSVGKYLPAAERVALCKTLGLKHVPVVDAEYMFDTDATIEQVLARAENFSTVNPKKQQEGLVFKEVNGGHHWKAISNKYLLKTGG
jgi:RNA ligase (TIGR02306 family)